MIHELTKRRNEVMERADRALDAAWPQRQGEDYVREMRMAAEQLETIAAEMRAAHFDRVEQSRTYRHLGGVYADLDPALGKQMLSKAVVAYQQAEDLLQGESDDLERAKLNFNYANTLRQLDPNNAGQLEDAQRRLLSAQSYFAAHEPQYLAQVETALQSVTALLRIAPLAGAVEKNARDMQKLEQELASGGDVGQIAEKMRTIMRRDGGVAGMTGRVKNLVDSLSPAQKQGEAYAKVQTQLEALSNKALSNGAAGKDEKQILAALRERLETDHAAGALSSDHAETVSGLLGQLGSVLGGADESPEEILAKLEKLRKLAGSWIDALHYPSYGIPRPASGTRAAALVELCWNLRRYLAEAQNQAGNGEDESKEALELSVRASRVDKRLYEAADDDVRASIIDIEELRPLSLAVRRFSARQQAMVARPIWSGANLPVVSNALFFSGQADISPLLSRVCGRIGLEIMPRPAGMSFAAERWTQLQKAMTAVFDLRTEQGTALSTVTYELGIALTLGKPIVVIVGPEQNLPFDVNVVPIVLAGGSKDDDILKSAIDQSLVWLYPSSRSASIITTLEYVLSQYPRPHANVYVDQSLRMLAELRQSPDPVTVGRTVSKFIDFLNDGHTMLIHPVWQPVYPSGDKFRVFHVMPFRPKWAEEVSRYTQQLVKGHGGQYVRGDAVADPDVIRSIWEELARATHVLVDLTGFNANVALELGIAHTLGQQVLMVNQGDADMYVFPSISKLRVHSYDVMKLETTLGKNIELFISTNLANAEV